MFSFLNSTAKSDKKRRHFAALRNKVSPLRYKAGPPLENRTDGNVDMVSHVSYSLYMDIIGHFPPFVNYEYFVKLTPGRGGAAKRGLWHFDTIS